MSPSSRSVSICPTRQGCILRLSIFQASDYHECVDLQTLRRDSLLFNPQDFGTIFAFVDFSNVRYWAKSFWAEDNRERLVREVDIEKVAQLIDMVGTAEKFFYYGHYKARPNLPPEHPSNLPYRN